MIWQVLDRYSYDGPLSGHGYDLRCFQKQVLTFLQNLDPLAKKSLCLYDDLGQLGKNDLIDLIVARHGSILLEDGVEKAVLEKIRNAYTNEARFRKDRASSSSTSLGRVPCTTARSSRSFSRRSVMAPF